MAETSPQQQVSLSDLLPPTLKPLDSPGANGNSAPQATPINDFKNTQASNINSAKASGDAKAAAPLMQSIAQQKFTLKDEANGSRTNLGNASSINLTSSGSFSNYINLILGGREGTQSLTSLTEQLPALDGKSTPSANINTTMNPNMNTTMNPNMNTNSTTTAQTVPTPPQIVPVTPTPTIAAQVTPVAQEQQVSDHNKQIILSEESNKATYVDITEYLNLPQTEAAKRLGIPTSTLSKRWKEAVVNRKWPYRTVCKLEKEIMTLLHNIPQGPDAPPLSPEIEHSLAILLRKRQEELRSVIIRL